MDPLARHVAARQDEEGRLRAERDRAEQEAAGAETAVQDSAARQAQAEAGQEAARQSQVDLLGRLAALQNARSPKRSDSSSRMPLPLGSCFAMSCGLTDRGSAAAARAPP